MKPGCVEYPAEQSGRWNWVTSTAQNPKVELLTHRIEAETGIRLTGATMEQARMTGILEEGRNLVERRGGGSPWRKLSNDRLRLIRRDKGTRKSARADGPWWRRRNVELGQS